MSLVLLPFSKRYWINLKLLCKRCLGQSEYSASSTQFVCQCYGRWKWIITKELENSREIADLRLSHVALPTKQGGFIRPELVRDLSLEESQRHLYLISLIERKNLAVEARLFGVMLVYGLYL